MDETVLHGDHTEKWSISGEELMKLKEEAHRGLGDLRSGVPSFVHCTSESWGVGSRREP